MLPEDLDLESLKEQDIEQITEELEKKEAKSRAEVLTILNDLPHEDIKPPENVLFVCKLNPATKDQDLETIFRKFGNVIGCEIIRDHKTGDSLCYGFVEYDTRKSAELAFVKMNNVLIDDRRIKVDFSQSVAKVVLYRYGGWKRYMELQKSEDGGGQVAELKKEPDAAMPRIKEENRTNTKKRSRESSDAAMPRIKEENRTNTRKRSRESRDDRDRDHRRHKRSKDSKYERERQRDSRGHRSRESR
eukprot:TRINITY_DN2191_c0_g1_i2.p1 TRINITY_DN2191_c0_g1~~TRINITY_DN2191_c0_g1_i2.p1  ORF type:complete len:246 (+),score=38.75 TRINITY_DN2191_c0_g1_i2:483-1220(+)